MAKNIILAVMAVLVIAGILFGLTYYRRSLMDSRTISEMEKKIARLDLKKEATDKERDALHKEVLVKSRALQSAEQTVAELRNTLQMKDREYQNSKERINDLEKSEADLNKRLAVQQDAVKSFKLQLEKKQAALGVLRNQIGQLHQALGKLKANRISVGPSAADLKEQLKKSQSKLVVCLNRTETAQKTKEQLQEKLSSLQEGKEQIESRLAAARKASRELVSKLQKQVQNQQIVIKQYKEKLTVRVVDRILFESGLASITPEGQELLRKVGGVLKGISGETIQVIGNTDNVPIAPEYRYRYASNWELSAARAAAVARFFQQKCGIDPKDMVAMGRSSYYPVASNSTPGGRARNRNVEIVIKPKLNGNAGPALAGP